MKISAVVLTKNEGKNIERCLKSLDFCDEIIVVDDFSTDETFELAKKLKAKVFQRALNDDFSSQRNFGLEKARENWLLFVDADEEVPEKLKKEIEEINGSFDGYFLGRKDLAFGSELKYGETTKVRLLRLARKGTGVWERPVHEIWKVKGNIKELKNPLIHYSHQDIISSLRKINYYSTIEANLRFQKKEKSGFLQILFYPSGKFLKNFFILRGFRDSLPGFLMAGLMSSHSFLVRVKLWELNNHVSDKYS